MEVKTKERGANAGFLGDCGLNTGADYGEELRARLGVERNGELSRRGADQK